MDMDPQFNATRGLGVDIEAGMPTVYDLIKENESIAATDVIVPTKWKGLDLVPSHGDLAGAEVELIDEDGRENRFERRP